LCCPTSQLHKPDVLGSIYRVRRTDAPKVDVPRGRKIDWSKLAITDAESALKVRFLLDDPRPAVRRRAVEVMGAGGRGSAVVLRVVAGASRSEEMSRNAVWAAIRIDHPIAREAVRVGLTSGDETESVTAELGSKSPAMKEAAWWIAGRHPEWAAALVGFLRDRLAAKELKPQEADDLAGQLARLARGQAVQDLLAERIADPSA